MKTLLFLFLIINLTIVVCFGQGTTVKADANACELNSLNLDGLRNELASNPTATIIAKSYTGKSENIGVGEKRVDYIRKFLERNKGFDLSRLEFVNGGRLETLENPKTEFYVVQSSETQGTLYLVTYSRPNRTPCLDCCGEDLLPRNIGSKPKPEKKTIKKPKKRGK
jgi:hypothetical protein